MRVSSIGRSPRWTSWVPGSSAGRRTRAALVADRPAQERAQAGQELLERERLDQVVVRAGVEPGDAVVDLVPRGQHQHRRPVPHPPQRAGRLRCRPSPASARRARSRRRRVRRAPSAPAGRPRPLDLVAFEAQSPLERLPHGALVVHDQNAHTRSVPDPPESSDEMPNRTRSSSTSSPTPRARPPPGSSPRSRPSSRSSRSRRCATRGSRRSTTCGSWSTARRAVRRSSSTRSSSPSSATRCATSAGARSSTTATSSARR